MRKSGGGKWRCGIWLTFCSVALIVQIHLQQNRADLAAKEAQRARKWAQDSLLVNIAESWVGMREVRVHDHRHRTTAS